MSNYNMPKILIPRHICCYLSKATNAGCCIQAWNLLFLFIAIIIKECCMPIFEYRCEKCGYKFEEIIQGDREKKIPCPKCGNTSTEKLISVIGGIAMGKSGSPQCGSSCPSAAECPSAGGGCCHR
jgi:putative FmdB family regulatory protein